MNKTGASGFLVGTDGDRNRYDAAYMLVYAKSGPMVKLSGTADVNSSQIQSDLYLGLFLYNRHAPILRQKNQTGGKFYEKEQ